MRQLKIIFITLVLLLFTTPALAASTQYIRRQNDTIPDQKLQEAVQLTQQAEAEQAQNAQPQSTGEVIPQVMNVYGWFEAVNTSVESSENTQLTGGETRMMLGQPESGRYLETIKIYTRNKNLTIKYNTKLSGQDWGVEAAGTYDLAQSSGNQADNSQKICNLNMYLNGPSSVNYSLYYRVYLPDSGWLPWASGATSTPAVTPELEESARIEALEIRVLPKGSPAPPDTVDMLSVPVLKAEGYVENTEWMDPALGRNITIGTEGQSLRLESFKVQTDNPNVQIQYQALANGIGWLDPAGDGNPTGTTDQFRAIEAVKMSLTGSEAQNYDLYYQAHIQYYGWLDWANNGQIAGTTNQDLRLEAVHIRILPKGAIAPGSCDVPSVTAADATEGSVLKSVNFLRKERGLSLLTGDDKLHEAALRRSGELAQRYSHIRPNNQGYQTVLQEVPYRTDGLIPALGENILQIPDANTAFTSFSQKETCLKLMLTSYYKYLAFVTNVTDQETGGGFSVMLLSDSPSLLGDSIKEIPSEEAAAGSQQVVTPNIVVDTSDSYTEDVFEDYSGEDSYTETPADTDAEDTYTQTPVEADVKDTYTEAPVETSGDEIQDTVYTETPEAAVLDENADSTVETQQIEGSEEPFNTEANAENIEE